MHKRFFEKTSNSEEFTSRHFFKLPFSDIRQQIERIRFEYSVLSIGVKIVVSPSWVDIALYRSTAFMTMEGVQDMANLDSYIQANMGNTIDLHVKLNNTFLPAPADETYQLVVGR